MSHTTVIYVEKAASAKKHWSEDRCFTCVGAPLKDAYKNNADVAVLCDGYPYILRKERYFAHLKQVMVPVTLRSLIALYTYGLRYLVRDILKKVDVVENADLLGYPQKFFVYDVCPKKDRMTQRDYYPEGWTPLQMLQEMDALGIRYVLMRWPQKVLDNAPMNDLDILIADEDAPKLRAFLKKSVGTKPIDIHTVHGGEIGRGDSIAYFPPAIAARILEKRMPLCEDGGSVPCLEDQFRSLAYHAVFNKGLRSGMDASDEGQSNGKIFDELMRLRAVLNLDVTLSLAGLLDYLKEIGWLPPSDMISKKAQGNAWLKDVFKGDEDLSAGLSGSYFVFILRDISYTWGIVDELRGLLNQNGFRIVHDAKLTDEQRARASSHIRGGNWSSGPWKTSGGYPCHVVLVEDPTPQKPSRQQRKKEPAILNARVCMKREWRELFNQRLEKDKQANFAHTSDNNLETIEYLKIIDPALVDLLK